VSGCTSGEKQIIDIMQGRSHVAPFLFFLLYREEEETDRRWLHDMPESGVNNEETREREISRDTMPDLDSGDRIDWDR